MTQAKKKKTAAKSSASGKGKRKASASKKKTVSPLGREIQNWLIFLILLLITLGIYLKGGMGILGSSLNRFFVGLLGFSAYLISVYSMMIAGMNLFGKLERRSWVKLIAGYAGIILAAVLFHIVNAGGITDTAQMYRNATFLTGGVIGGVIGRLMISLIGKPVSLVVIIFLILIDGIIITERSVVRGMKTAAGKTREKTRQVKTYTTDKAEAYALRRQERKEQALLREEEKKAWADAQPEKPRLDMEEAAFPGADQQIVIHGLKTTQETGKTMAASKKETDTIDIPLLSHDTYLEKKKRFERRRQQQQQPETEEAAPEETDSGIAAEAVPVKPEPPQEACLTEPENVPAAEAIGMPVEEEQELTPERKPQQPEIVLPEPEEILDSDISTEKAFAKEEFPTGYQDQDETLRRMGIHETGKEQAVSPKKPGPSGKYEFPSIELLTQGNRDAVGSTKEELLKSAKVLENALLSFGVEARVVQVNRGPAVTRFELQPKQGVKVSRIVSLTDDIAMNLAAPSIRIEAPIPGKSAVGIEVPNPETSMVTLREVIDSDTFRKASSKLTFALGKDIDGEVRVADIAKMPHLLIAGATGSGKSVCINSLIVSLIYKADPNEVKLILIDPKVVELSVYNGIPHLLLPVVNEPKKASATLNWAVQEMTRRYKKFAEMNVRDIRGYNAAVVELGEEEKKMPQIVIIIDELADLMMVASKEVEASICRIAQMARAAGMHLVIATQRPSVDVITGLIKANIPSRLAFAVSSGVDSRTILDNVGAEKLLGKGDMLFCPIGASKPVRIQGTFVSDKEVEAVVEAVRLQSLNYDSDLMDTLQREGGSEAGGIEDEIDEYLEEAVKFVVDKQRASISMLQRAFRIGFNRAARLMDALYARGVVGPDEGSKPRKVLMTKEEWENQEYQ